eukprot:14038587-Alexandrium_andersonii.AAC.1
MLVLVHAPMPPPPPMLVYARVPVVVFLPTQGFASRVWLSRAQACIRAHSRSRAFVHEYAC